MSSNQASVVLAHGAWADGSSWAKVIAPLAADGIRVIAALLPLTSFEEDVAALDRTVERAPGPIVLVGHAYSAGRGARDYPRGDGRSRRRLKGAIAGVPFVSDNPVLQRIAR